MRRVVEGAPVSSVSSSTFNGPTLLHCALRWARVPCLTTGAPRLATHLCALTTITSRILVDARGLRYAGKVVVSCSLQIQPGRIVLWQRVVRR